MPTILANIKNIKQTKKMKVLTIIITSLLFTSLVSYSNDLATYQKKYEQEVTKLNTNYVKALQRLQTILKNKRDYVQLAEVEKELEKMEKLVASPKKTISQQQLPQLVIKSATWGRNEERYEVKQEVTDFIEDNQIVNVRMNAQSFGNISENNAYNALLLEYKVGNTSYKGKWVSGTDLNLPYPYQVYSGDEIFLEQFKWELKKGANYHDAEFYENGRVVIDGDVWKWRVSRDNVITLTNPDHKKYTASYEKWTNPILLRTTKNEIISLYHSKK